MSEAWFSLWLNWLSRNVLYMSLENIRAFIIATTNCKESQKNNIIYYYSRTWYSLILASTLSIHGKHTIEEYIYIQFRKNRSVVCISKNCCTVKVLDHDKLQELMNVCWWNSSKLSLLLWVGFKSLIYFAIFNNEWVLT